MLKRTLFFTNPAYLSVRQKQLVVKTKDSDTERSVPIEDIGIVILEHPQISMTMPTLQQLNTNNVAVIFCDEKHMPASMLLNLDGHHLQNEIFRKQINSSQPLKKQLWQQTIVAKIKNQAALLKSKSIDSGSLVSLASSVKSDDSTNREGTAAREYWGRLFDNDFTRDRYGAYPNNLLNYGYIVLRSAVARALVGSGLLPTLGIHHSNRYNAYCLADDIMEPYRPYVDDVIYEMWQSGNGELILEKETKAHLLQVLSCDVSIGEVKRPLLLALSHTTASLARCFNGEGKKILYPTFFKE
ncbi:type II CRISPR-associated endonuclease Cas1 [Carboxylicivirga marina]|uniref:CRISPR-associated endonuclease Cas1 n=1 Tax=Carboxylicivirga marina TaxID=2800988 RepID=A0ABS1HDN0_9BACT|nr:type II CRISPR-associated endonuclease Cas1 [Carboxylicivirga marina]MBK3515735.1 type II CRISPR-associated endonuclease Cas1 [Carboxylicivirga marina]